MNKLLKVLIFISFIVILTINVSANSIIELDFTEVNWSQNEFIYDDTVKCVELINVPDVVEVSYKNNSCKDLGTYFASASFNYDKTKYKLINYDSEKYHNYSWSIIRGKYNTSSLIFKDSVFLFDGNSHSINVLNVPEGVEVIYEGNNQVNPGVYKVTAKFIGNPYYVGIPSMEATLTINHKELICSDGKCKISSIYSGFNPDFSLVHENLDSSLYDDLDLSNLGSYREVKTGLKLNIIDKDQRIHNINEEVTIIIKLSEELLKSEILEIYEYSNSGISKIDSYINSGHIIFRCNSLNEEFLIIGMRQTYSQGDAWKIGLMFLILAFFICVILIGKKVSRKHRFYR